MIDIWKKEEREIGRTEGRKLERSKKGTKRRKVGRKEGRMIEGRKEGRKEGRRV